MSASFMIKGLGWTKVLCIWTFLYGKTWTWHSIESHIILLPSVSLVGASGSTMPRSWQGMNKEGKRIMWPVTHVLAYGSVAQVIAPFLIISMDFILRYGLYCIDKASVPKRNIPPISQPKLFFTPSFAFTVTVSRKVVVAAIVEVETHWLLLEHFNPLPQQILPQHSRPSAQQLSPQHVSISLQQPPSLQHLESPWHALPGSWQQIPQIQVVPPQVT